MGVAGREKQEGKPAVSQQPTVCVIEDDEDTRHALRFLLEDAGYHVVEASDGIVGYRLLTDSKQRLIVLVDQKMPRMDGCDLLELIEQDETLRAQHTFIMMSASPQRAEQDCGDTLEELDAPVVSKPFALDEVLNTVAEAAQRLDLAS